MGSASAALTRLSSSRSLLVCTAEAVLNEELSRFVRDALTRGLARADIRTTLLSAGWAEDAVDHALSAWAEVDFPVPVPRPRPYLSAREAFVYLALFATLYASALSFGALIFQFIERAWPDPARDLVAAGSLEAVRWSTSWLLISFPALLWLSRRTYLANRREPERRTSRIRKWLTYLTLFAASSVLLGDLVAMVFNWLAGGLTARFLLKVVAVAAIAGAVLAYLSRDLKEDDASPEEMVGPRPGLRWFASGVSAVVAVALIAGLVVAGSPGRARARQLDSRRETDLAAIASAIDRYWIWHERLPNSLEELSSERRVSLRSVGDPESSLAYQYRITGDRTYELCATFDTPEREPGSRADALPGNEFWRHPAGRHCFQVEVRIED